MSDKPKVWQCNCNHQTAVVDLADYRKLEADLKAAQDQIELLSYRGPSEHVAHISELRAKLAAANEKLENLEGKTAKPAEGGHRPKQ